MFSQAAKYAIKAVIYIWTQSLENRRVGSKEIGGKIKTPEAFTAKILQPLVKAKLIGSIKGPNGGFFVNESHEEVTLKDIIKAVDGDGLFSGCSLGLPNCSEKNPCPLHFEVVKVRKELDNMLTSKSIKQLAIEVLNGETRLAKVV
ncbi:Rrf2 family transcriptional regulator [Marivirga sp.]|uniref:RrF2 family transcriptional regulator n=1 Tax=Marivirga sp. TaxID=2018662 RepID=UPI0025F736C2|nr:Rrf2 family transcriptional regulator [Marivirga sp.]